MADLRAQCWNCGEPARCERCGSQELRKGRGDCADCHRFAEWVRKHPGATREDWQQQRERDIEVTPAMRAYLSAFDAWLREPSRTSQRERLRALDVLRATGGSECST